MEENRAIILSQAQQQAVDTTEGAVMVISCAGSGKTSVILERTRRIAEKGGKPSRILVTTFSKAAAGEMEQRYRERYGRSGVRFSTIHSLCYSVLAGCLGLTAEAILKEGERRSFFQQEYGRDMQRGQKLPEDFEEYYSDMTAYISKRLMEKAENEVKQAENEASRAENGAKQAENEARQAAGKQVLRQESAAADRKEDRYKNQILQRYQSFKERNGKVDFDDMIIRCYQCLRESREVLEYWQGVFDYLMIDEFQDTTFVQAEIFFLLAQKHGNICVVGDDDQSIYGFRGADSRIFKRFQSRFPECRIVMLDTNYRSLPGIVERAACVIGHNSERFAKDFRAFRQGEAVVRVMNPVGDREQIAAVLKGIEDSLREGRRYSDIAVLYRVKKEAATLVNRLLLEEIPFQIRELPEDIHKGLVYRDILAYSRLAHGIPEPGDLVQIINRPSRYIKTNLVKGCPVERNAVYRACSAEAQTPYEYDRINDTVNQLFLDLRNLRELSPAEFLGYLKWEMKYTESLRDYAGYRGIDEDELLRNYAALQNEAARFQTMEEWEDYVLENRRVDCRNPDGIYLSTFHGAKGLQWKEVYIISANEQITPYQHGRQCAELEEERRLFYVAMTRAEDRLTILYRKGEKGRGQEPSRFIEEMR